MGKTMVDPDDDALRATKVVLGTLTKKDTINQALEAVVATARRADAVAAEIERGHAGFYRRLLDDDVADLLRR